MEIDEVILNREEILEDLLERAWGLIANAEQFRDELVCCHEHCVSNDHYTSTDTRPVGGPEGEVWRDAARKWRDNWHETLRS